MARQDSGCSPAPSPWRRCGRWPPRPGGVETTVGRSPHGLWVVAVRGNLLRVAVQGGAPEVRGDSRGSSPADREHATGSLRVTRLLDPAGFLAGDGRQLRRAIGSPPDALLAETVRGFEVDRFVPLLGGPAREPSRSGVIRVRARRVLPALLTPGEPSSAAGWLPGTVRREPARARTCSPVTPVRPPPWPVGRPAGARSRRPGRAR